MPYGAEATNLLQRLLEKTKADKEEEKSVPETADDFSIPVGFICSLTPLNHPSEVKSLLLSLTGESWDDGDNEVDLPDVILCVLYNTLIGMGQDALHVTAGLRMLVLSGIDSAVEAALQAFLHGQDDESESVIAVQVLDGRYYGLTGVPRLYDTWEMKWIDPESDPIDEPLSSIALSVPAILQRSLLIFAEIAEDLQSRAGSE